MFNTEITVFIDGLSCNTRVAVYEGWLVCKVVPVIQPKASVVYVPCLVENSQVIHEHLHNHDK